MNPISPSLITLLLLQNPILSWLTHPHGCAKTNHEVRRLQLIGMNQTYVVLFAWLTSHRDGVCATWVCVTATDGSSRPGCSATLLPAFQLFSLDSPLPTGGPQCHPPSGGIWFIHSSLWSFCSYYTAAAWLCQTQSNTLSNVFKCSFYTCFLALVHLLNCASFVQQSNKDLETLHCVILGPSVIPFAHFINIVVYSASIFEFPFYFTVRKVTVSFRAPWFG